MRVNRSSYIKWRTNKGTKSKQEIERERLMPLIEKCHKNKPSRGYHNIAAYLRDNYGYDKSDNLIHKCCKYMGIKSQVKHYRQKYTRPGNEHLIFENELNNDWSTNKPLEKITSDMTCIKHRGRLYDVVLYMDAFNNEILSYAYTNKHNNSAPYYEGLNILLSKLKGIETQIVLHTDQGATYSSRVFNNTYKDYNIIRSMSRAGTPTDNPKIESINGWIKAEIDSDWDINSYDNFGEFLDQYIYYYNNQRYAYSLKYKTPVQYRTEQGF